jgi:hypothetical protein
MKLIAAAAVALHLPSCVLQAQQPTPSRSPDSAVVQRFERIERQNAIDSLAAGRLRWQRAGIVEYRLQTDYACFCPPNPDDPPRPRDLLTIRDGRVVARSAGKGGPSHTDHPSWTVDSLFAVIADDLADRDRKVRQLTLHPSYGLPLRYAAGRTAWEDTWIEIAVDSFAVVRKAARSGRQRSP